MTNNPNENPDELPGGSNESSDLGESNDADNTSQSDMPQSEDGVNAFDLSVPTGNLAEVDDGERAEVEKSDPAIPKVPEAGQSYRGGVWKGINEDEDEEEEPAVAFGSKEKIPEDELDMTPMVDVTFLLLIFFMITASFTIQKSMQQPPASSDEASLNVQQEEEANDYVEVIIDQNNTYYVTSRGEEEREAPSETEMRTLVKDAVDTFGPTRLVITAHVDATYSRYITACDAGQINKLSIEAKTTDVEF